MAQFDVHRNPGRNRAAIPFIVIVQSSALDAFSRRVVIPLVRKADFRTVHHAGFNPSFDIEGTPVVLHPLEMVSVPVDGLGERVGSLADEGSEIIKAIDELISRAYG